MPIETPDTSLVSQFNSFFGEAFRDRAVLSRERLQQLFQKHVSITPEEASALILQARMNPSALSYLSAQLKIAADAAHPRITGIMTDEDILNYTINSLADGHGIQLDPRFGVNLPGRMADHGDSLFLHEEQRKCEST